MKQIIVPMMIIAGFISCSDKKSNESQTVTDSTGVTVATPAADSASVDQLLTGYLDLKNALATDNSRQAATAARSISAQLDALNNASMSAGQKTLFTEIYPDMKEHSSHIGDNAGKIDHQREHFDMLSTDMRDLVKVFPVNRTIYIDHCPMYNDKKGANWLSEVKEIKNPYYGKGMLECGTVKEEISGK